MIFFKKTRYLNNFTAFFLTHMTTSALFNLKTFTISLSQIYVGGNMKKVMIIENIAKNMRKRIKNKLCKVLIFNQLVPKPMLVYSK